VPCVGFVLSLEGLGFPTLRAVVELDCWATDGRADALEKLFDPLLFVGREATLDPLGRDEPAAGALDGVASMY
jgi:hypothetical protein